MTKKQIQKWADNRLKRFRRPCRKLRVSTNHINHRWHLSILLPKPGRKKHQWQLIEGKGKTLKTAHQQLTAALSRVSQP